MRDIFDFDQGGPLPGAGKAAPVLKTYALYLRASGASGDAASRVEAITCGTNAEAMQQARRLLAQDPAYDAVDVVCGDVELFRVRRERPAPARK